MTEYKLSGWPDLPERQFTRTAYQRMLHALSLRYATVDQLARQTGLPRRQVKRFLKQLKAIGVTEIRQTSDWMLGWEKSQKWMRKWTAHCRTAIHL
jgi:hypothetical protein